MVIDISDVRHVGTKICNHVTQFPSRLGGIDCVRRLPDPGKQSNGWALEINIAYEVSIIGSRVATRISHREQRNVMPP